MKYLLIILLFASCSTYKPEIGFTRKALCKEIKNDTAYFISYYNCKRAKPCFIEFKGLNRNYEVGCYYWVKYTNL